jgi:mRNA interferase RelE/StbE
MYELQFSEDALRTFAKFDKSTQERIGKVIERIKIRPLDFVEKCVGDTSFKLRVGDYRLFLDINNQILIITVITIDHRRNAYKK